MSTYATRPVGSHAPANDALRDVLKQIAVPMEVLLEGKRRRDLVRRIAMEHAAARRSFASGSVAHGTHNEPFEDADCGVVLNRQYEAFRAFGPDAPGQGFGPEGFIKMFASFITPRLQANGYPRARVDLSGNRALKFLFNETIEFDGWGRVDPYVDLILGLTRRDGDGLWIPNRRIGWWDAAHPEKHTWLMTECDEKALRVHRAHVIRLSKRAVKRDARTRDREPIVCSWNISALALALIDEVKPIGVALMEFLDGAAREISQGLTEDPARVSDPISLPEGVSNQATAMRLAAMAGVVSEALSESTAAQAEAKLELLFGVEIEAIRDRRARDRRNDLLKRSLVTGSGAGIATALGASRPPKAMASYGE